MGFSGTKYIYSLVPPNQVETMVHTAESGPTYIKPHCVIQFKYSAEQMVSTTEQFRALSPERRGCLYPHERRLNYFTHYHKSNCMLECAWQRAWETCGCHPWFLAGPETRTVLFDTTTQGLCDAVGMNCFDGIVDSVMSGDRDNICPDCPPDCELVAYEVSIETGNDDGSTFGVCSGARARLACDFRSEECRQSVVSGEGARISNSSFSDPK